MGARAAFGTQEQEDGMGAGEPEAGHEFLRSRRLRSALSSVPEFQIPELSWVPVPETSAPGCSRPARPGTSRKLSFCINLLAISFL